MDPLVALGLGATLFSTINQYNANKDNVKALANKSKLLNIQAQEVLDRNVETRKQMVVQGQEIFGAQATSLAKLGILATEGSSLMEMEHSMGVLTEELIKSKREAYYTAKAIRSESKYATSQAEDLKSAMGISAATSLLQGGMNTALAAGWRP